MLHDRLYAFDDSSSQFAPPRTEILKNRLRIVLIVCGVTALAAIGFALYIVHGSLDAERTLHAYDLVLQLLTVYVNQNSGRWPKNWDDLTTVSLAEQSSIFRWPNEVDEIRQRVYVDFSINGLDVAAMNVDDFSAVKQIGPNYGPSERRIRELLEATRRESQESSHAEAP